MKFIDFFFPWSERTAIREKSSTTRKWSREFLWNLIKLNIVFHVSLNSNCKSSFFFVLQDLALPRIAWTFFSDKVYVFFNHSWINFSPSIFMFELLIRQRSRINKSFVRQFLLSSVPSNAFLLSSNCIRFFKNLII